MIIDRKNSRIELSMHFRLREFDCKCGIGHPTIIHPQLIKLLQFLRDWYQRPLSITSGHRCYHHNKKVGGAIYSRHQTGEAADVLVDDPRSASKVAHGWLLSENGGGGVGVYSNRIHVDVRTPEISLWDGE